METIKYITSLLTFYLKGEISSEQNFITFKEPNTILGIIPLGARKESVAIDQIASTQTNMKMKFGKLLLGLLICFVALVSFFESFFGGLILLALGANLIIDAFEIDLQIKMTSGQVRAIDFFVFEKHKAENAERQINAMIASRLNDTNNRQQADRIIEAINNR